MSSRNCYCREDRPPPPGVPPGYCGICRICDAPGHARHHPGYLPYTGAWCDAHYDQMQQIYARAFSQPEADESCLLPKQNCRYIRVPEVFTHRRLFRRYPMDAYLEFRSDVLARYVLCQPRFQIYERHQRWDQPLSMWLHPYPMERDDSWQDITESEFEALWQRSLFPKGSPRRKKQDSA